MNLFGARLRAICSSDIGHWDVPDITEVAEEAYDLVEGERIERGLRHRYNQRDNSARAFRMAT